MKTFTLPIFLFVLCLSSNATNKIVVGNAGQGWANGNNFSPTGVPQSGDSVTIPAGMTLTVKGNVYGTMTLLKIYIYGNMDFDPSGKLDLTVSSLVQIFTNGTITTNGSSSEIISMGGVVKYNGQNDGTVTGPKYASAASAFSTGIADDAGFNFGVLPVNLVSFGLTSRNNEVNLSWKLDSDPDIESLIVQKRINEVWRDLKTERLNEGLRQTALSYSYIDKLPNQGENFYRLKFVSRGGAVDYSKILMANINLPTGLFSVYPNPAKNKASIRLKRMTNAGKVSILNASGITVYEKETSGGLNQVCIDLSLLENGFYYLIFSENNRALEKTSFVISR